MATTENNLAVDRNDTLESENLNSREEFYENLSLGIQASAAFIGFIGNSLTFLTLRKNGHIFAPTVSKLMKNQAILDAVTCLLGSIYVLQPPMWKTYWSENFDIFICHVSSKKCVCTMCGGRWMSDEYL